MNEKLIFGFGNSKLSKAVVTFSLSAGHSCKFAKDCRSCVENGKIKDGPHCKFRCFSATQEAVFPNVRKARAHNLNTLKGKTAKEMYLIILNNLPKDYSTYRIHISGDYFNQAYFNAWLAIAKTFPDKLFYSYTKALPYVVNQLDNIPSNFILTASRGGTHDHLIEQYNLKSVEVVYSEQEAIDKGLQIDHDDSLARNPSINKFGLLIHGTMPKLSYASIMMHKLRKEGKNGYGKRVGVRSYGLNNKKVDNSNNLATIA